MLWLSISRRNAFTTIPFTRHLVPNASKSSSNNSQGGRTVIRLCSEEVISGFFLCEIQMPCSAISVIPCASQPEVSGLEHGPPERDHHSLFEFLLSSSPDLPALSQLEQARLNKRRCYHRAARIFLDPPRQNRPSQVFVSVPQFPCITTI